MTRCHFASASSLAQGGAQSLPNPAISPPALLRPNPTLSSQDPEPWPMDCNARLPGDHSRMPVRVPGASRWQLCVQGTQGVSLPLISRPRASPGVARGPQARPASRFLSRGLQDCGRPWRRAPHKPTQGECGSARGCQAWGLNLGLASGKHGTLCMCVRGRRGCGSWGGRGCHRVPARAAYSSARGRAGQFQEHGSRPRPG